MISWEEHCLPIKSNYIGYLRNKDNNGTNLLYGKLKERPENLTAEQSRKLTFLPKNSFEV